MQRALRMLVKGRTTFVIAHRLSTVHSADTILVLKDGQLVEPGRYDELRAADAAADLVAASVADSE